MLAMLDRIWWARTIRRAHVVDNVFVSAQLGRAVSESAAIRAYVRGGFRSGLSLNPMFLEAHVSAQLPDSTRVPALYAYLVSDPTKVSTSLVWDAPAFAVARPDSLNVSGGPLGLAWREAARGTSLTIGIGGSTRQITLDALRDASTQALQRSEEHLVPAECILVWNLVDADADGTDLRAMLRVAQDRDAAVALGLHGVRMDVRIVAGQIALAWPYATLTDKPAPADVLRAGAEDGTLFAVRDSGASIGSDDLSRLLTSARERPVGAVWIDDAGVVVSAGTRAHEGRLFPLLAGHPREDLRELGEVLPVTALDSPVRAEILGQYAAPATLLTSFAASPGAPVHHAPAGASVPAESSLSVGRGLEVYSWSARGPIFGRATESFVRDDGSTVPRLRWAIKTAAPAGPRGESWGDTHFARGIAAALERQGQYVAVDARPAAGRPSSSLDDVQLVLRGPERIKPPSSGVRVIWIISHPDEITADELAAFDLRYAASDGWAQRASARLGHAITPLLQCTDTARFSPSGTARTHDLVFVGTARGIARPAVIEPLRAGAPLRVYGPDWRGYIPASAITATHVPNDELPALYEAAGAVLNDHWPAMQREGFISNRLYDVVAAGGRAISDEVIGIAETFGGAVQTFATDAELRTISTAELDGLFPAEEDLRRIAGRIRAEHSFDARARTLLNHVVAQRAGDLENH